MKKRLWLPLALLAALLLVAVSATGGSARTAAVGGAGAPGKDDVVAKAGDAKPMPKFVEKKQGERLARRTSSRAGRRRPMQTASSR